MTPTNSSRSSPLSCNPRIDLHCHSNASTEADEALLLAINCPESYSEPEQVYRQAKQRSMRFVTITDHDSLTGVQSLSHHPDILIGEELTCYFPEDRCKIHLLIWGLSSDQHAALQSVAADIYAVAQRVHEYDLAHAVAHPLYRQNNVLSRWHIERLLLLFKGFECLNGAHSSLHRDAFEPVIERLDREELTRLEEKHNLPALGRIPWIKTRTGGSDDHGLFNIGRTYTEFPSDTHTVSDVLDCLKNARCWPGGETGSSIKLAHNFYGVGIRYFTRNLADESSTVRPLLERIVGDNTSDSSFYLALPLIKLFSSQLLSKATQMFRPERPRGTRLLQDLLLTAGRAQLNNHPNLTSAFRQGTAPLSHHEDVFSFISSLNLDVANDLGDSISAAIRSGNLSEIFDNLSAILAQQALLLPYYFALFHQNQERHLLAALTGKPLRSPSHAPRIAVFTDDISGPSPASLFATGLSRFATLRDLPISFLSLSPEPAISTHHHTFKPLFSTLIPQLNQTLAIPPILDLLEHADRHQYDAIVINSSSLMGLAGYLTAQMLRVPLILVSHDNLPQTVFNISEGDYRITDAARGYTRWLTSSAKSVIARSRTHLASLQSLGIPHDRLHLAPPACPADSFEPETAPDVLASHVRQSFRLIAHVDTTSKSDADFLASIFKCLNTYRTDIALIAVGKGPWTSRLFSQLSGLPVYAVEVAPADLPHLYASGDLFLAPSTDDLTASYALTSLHAGLPVLALQNSASADLIDDNLTGLALPPLDPTPWAHSIVNLLNDEMRLSRMSRTATQRVVRYTTGRDYELLLSECTRLIAEQNAQLMSSPLAQSNVPVASSSPSPTSERMAL